MYKLFFAIVFKTHAPPHPLLFVMIYDVVTSSKKFFSHFSYYTLLTSWEK